MAQEWFRVAVLRLFYLKAIHISATLSLETALGMPPPFLPPGAREMHRSKDSLLPGNRYSFGVDSLQCFIKRTFLSLQKPQNPQL